MWSEASFSMLINYLHIFSDEVSGKHIGPFFFFFLIGPLCFICLLMVFFRWFVFIYLLFLVLSLKNSLCILDNSTFTDVSFTNIFSQSMNCFYSPFIMSFSEQKFFILWSLAYSFSLSWIMSLMLYLKRYIHTQDCWNFLLCYLIDVS